MQVLVLHMLYILTWSVDTYDLFVVLAFLQKVITVVKKMSQTLRRQMELVVRL